MAIVARRVARVKDTQKSSFAQESQETKKAGSEKFRTGLDRWEKRLEPSTFGATIRCSIQLSYSHRRRNAPKDVALNVSDPSLPTNQPLTKGYAYYSPLFYRVKRLFEKTTKDVVYLSICVATRLLPQ